MVFEHGKYHESCSMAIVSMSTSIDSSSTVWVLHLDLTINGPIVPVTQHMHLPLGDIKTWHTLVSGHRYRWWPSLHWHANCNCRVNDINSMISVEVHQKWLCTVCGGVWCLPLHPFPLLLTFGKGGYGIWWECIQEICMDELHSVFVKPRYWATQSTRPCQLMFTNLKWYFEPDHAGSASSDVYHEVQSES